MEDARSDVPRIIAHFDMDAFFAAVEEKDKPHLKGKPIVVGADPEDGRGRGVVSTANYPAREYGIRSAMPIREAWRRALEGKKKGGPEVVWISPRGARYGEVSREIMNILREHAEKVEQTSVDEAYLDVSAAGSFAAAEKLCRRLQREIYEKEGLTVSVGIGPNKLIAKIASDRKKPAGLTLVGADDPDECARRAEDFLEPLPIRTIPGVGPKTEESLGRLGVRTVGDLKSFSTEQLTERFGVRGEDFYHKIRGRDDSPLVTEYEAKSVGEQTTFDKDSRDPQFLMLALKQLAEDSFRALKKEGFSECCKVVVVVRFGDFETVSRGKTLPLPIRTEEGAAFEAAKLFMPFLDHRENPRSKAFRLLGVRYEKLS